MRKNLLCLTFVLLLVASATAFASLMTVSAAKPCKKHTPVLSWSKYNDYRCSCIRKCKKCGKRLSSSIPYHDYKEIITKRSKTQHWLKKKCRKCGHTVKVNGPIKHCYYKGKCIQCGYRK